MSDLGEKFGPGELIASQGEKPDAELKRQYGKQLENLPEKYQNILKKLCQKIAMRDQFARIEEVKRAAERRFYWRGMFDVVWNEKDSLWMQPYGGQLFKDSKDTGDVELSYPVNIFQAFGRGFISIVSEVPNVRMEAKGDDPSAMRIANSADGMRRNIEALNDMDAFAQDVSRLYWTDGRVLFYSRWVTDGARFGYYDEEHVDEESEGLGKGSENPPEKKPRRARGGEVTTPYGVLEGKVPINMREQPEFPFIQISIEVDVTSAKSLYSWYAKRISGGQPGPGEYNFDRTTRIACSQGIKLLTQSGDTVEQLPTWQRTWMRPSMYADIENEADRSFFEDNFPDGAFVAFMGETYCESRNESMDDHFVVSHPLPGDGQATPAAGEIIMPIQDAINDITDLKMERAMKSIPAIWCDKTVVPNLAAIAKQKAGPGAHYSAEMPEGGKMADGFWPEPTPQASADEDEMWQSLFGNIPQFLTGLFPSALGSPDESNETLGGIKELSNASKGQAGVAWRAFRKAYAKAMMQLVRIGAYWRMSEAEDGLVKINPPGEAEIEVDLEDLHDGNWWCFPDGDESFPNTHADRRAAYMGLVQLSATNQAVAATLADPKNQVLAKDMIGLPDLEIPGADETEKTLADIKQLISDGTPIPNQQAIMQYKLAAAAAQMQGQQPPPQPKPEALLQPSVPVDEDFDDHTIAWNTVKDFVNSSAGQELKRSNPDAFMNVRLFGLAHKALMQKEAQAAAQQALAPQLVLEQAKHSGQAKQPAESIAFKDLGPSGKLQVGKQAGLDLIADVAAD